MSKDGYLGTDGYVGKDESVVTDGSVGKVGSMGTVGSMGKVGHVGEARNGAKGTLYLIRHCEATGQAADAPLTERGRQQAVALADQLTGLGILRIISSPYRRAIESVAPFAEQAGLQVETDALLEERVLAGGDLPDWRERLEQTFADADLCYPGGESSRQAAARGMAVISQVLGGGGVSADPVGPGATVPAAGAVALVSHGCLLTLLLREFDPGVGFSDWARMSNPDLYRVVVGSSGARVERVWREAPQ